MDRQVQHQRQHAHHAAAGAAPASSSAPVEPLKLYTVGELTADTPLAGLLATLTTSGHQATAATAEAAAALRRWELVPLSPATIPGTAFELRTAAAAIVAHAPVATGAEASDQQQQACEQVLAQLRAASRTLFIVLWHPDATEDGGMRWGAFGAGANMVTHCPHAVAAALRQVAAQQVPATGGSGSSSSSGGSSSSGSSSSGGSGSGCLMCAWCGLPCLTAATYWAHQPLYHIHHANREGVCPVCGRRTANLARHLHDAHAPDGRPPEERTGVFALVIIRRPADGKFLMTQEFAGSGFWVPGGGVDPGESLSAAAVRECWEEAGVRVELRGILAVESRQGGAWGPWRRVIFWGEPLEIQDDDGDPTAAAAAAAAVAAAAAAALPAGRSMLLSPPPGAQHQQQQHCLWRCCCPKTLPDFESAGAAWVGLAELSRLPLRSASEPTTWFPKMHDGSAQTLPLYHSLQLPPEWAGVFAGFEV